jgi:hypothetical protein
VVDGWIDDVPRGSAKRIQRALPWARRSIQPTSPGAFIDESESEAAPAAID